MKVNVIKTRRLMLLLGLVMVLSVVFAACVDTTSVPDILDESRISEESTEVVETSEDDISTPDGYTEAPVVSGMVNIEPTKIAIYGTCVENATIRVVGGKEDAETTAHGEYYVIEVDIWDRDTLLQVTAQAGEDEESLPREVIAHKDATADTLLDGNSVSVGAASRLYFDKMIADILGENLYTSSQLNDIRDYVTDTVTSYYNDRAGGQEVELIYVLIPNVTSLYPEILPEDLFLDEDGNKIPEPKTTIYQQIVETLNQTRATVIDMKPVFEAALQDTANLEQYGALYRETDSSLTDYGAYLTYRELMTVVSARFPDAAPRTENEFTWNQVDIKGGNLVNYRELDGDVIGESIIAAVPQFDMSLGSNTTGSSKLNSLKKYVNIDDNDYNFFTAFDSTDGINGISERWLIDTSARTDGLELPSAIVYRDYSGLSFSDILAERFSKCMLGKMGELTINLSTTTQYANEGDNVVDYVIVIVSEENMDSAFNIALS